VNERTGEQKTISNAQMEQSRINLHEWLQNQGFELLRTETWKDREKDNADITKNQ
jgi:tRNA nucleotidyltransferase (CCA-adding enzyme)